MAVGGNLGGRPDVLFGVGRGRNGKGSPTGESRASGRPEKVDLPVLDLGDRGHSARRCTHRVFLPSLQLTGFIRPESVQPSQGSKALSTVIEQPVEARL